MDECKPLPLVPATGATAWSMSNPRISWRTAASTRSGGPAGSSTGSKGSGGAERAWEREWEWEENAAAASGQRLTLVHFSAQRKHNLLDALGA